MKSKILVTGGCGFIGSHIVDNYLENGHRVIVLDDLSNANLKNLNKKATFYKCDICNYEKLEEILKKEKPDFINHHAAQIKTQLSLEDPSKDSRVNLLASLNLLKLAKKYQLKKFIFASTSAIYGDTDTIPTTEEQKAQPITPYGINKHAFEQNLRNNKQIPYTILRYSNVYGPRQKSNNEGGVVAIFIKQKLNNKALTINGTGKQSRDFVYIKDIVSANLLALSQGSNKIFNIGTGKAIPINKLAKLIAPNSKKKYQNKIPREITHSSLNRNKAKKFLNWSPKYSLEQGIKETIQYFTNA